MSVFRTPVSFIHHQLICSSKRFYGGLTTSLVRAHGLVPRDKESLLTAEPAFDICIKTSVETAVDDYKYRGYSHKRLKCSLEGIINRLRPDVFLGLLSLNSYRMLNGVNIWLSFAKYLVKHQDAFTVSELAHILYIFGRYDYLTEEVFRLCIQQHLTHMESLEILDVAKWIFASGTLYVKQQQLPLSTSCFRIKEAVQTYLLPLYAAKLKPLANMQQECEPFHFMSVLLTLHGCVALGIPLTEKIHQIHSDVFSSGLRACTAALTPVKPQSPRTIYALPYSSTLPASGPETQCCPTTQQTLEYLTLTLLAAHWDNHVFSTVLDLICRLDTVLPFDNINSIGPSFLRQMPKRNRFENTIGLQPPEDSRGSHDVLDALGFDTTQPIGRDTTLRRSLLDDPCDCLLVALLTLPVETCEDFSCSRRYQLYFQVKLLQTMQRQHEYTTPLGPQVPAKRVTQYVEQQMQYRMQQTTPIPLSSVIRHPRWQWSLLDRCTVLNIFCASQYSGSSTTTESASEDFSILVPSCKLRNLGSQCTASFSKYLVTGNSALAVKTSLLYHRANESDISSKTSESFKFPFGLAVQFIATLKSFPESESLNKALYSQISDLLDAKAATFPEILGLAIFMCHPPISASPLTTTLMIKIQKCIDMHIGYLSNICEVMRDRRFQDVVRQLERTIGAIFKKPDPGQVDR